MIVELCEAKNRWISPAGWWWETKIDVVMVESDIGFETKQAAQEHARTWLCEHGFLAEGEVIEWD